MGNVRTIYLDWGGGILQSEHGGHLARQYDHLSNLVVFSNAPALDNYYLIVEMKEHEDDIVASEQYPIQLAGPYWLIPNTYTQLVQPITFQVCCKTTNGDFEKHSARYTMNVIESLGHTVRAGSDPSIMFEPYKEYLDEHANEIAGNAIANWLDEHPITADVADNSLTQLKFTPALRKETLKDYVTPEMYGAVGDGTTDDTTAFQNTLLDGRMVFLKAGATYKITASLRVKKSTSVEMNGATIVGTSSRLMYNFEDDDIYTGYSGNGDIHFSNGRITAGCISFWHAENISFDNIEFYHCISGHYFEICACKNFSFCNCKFIGMKEQSFSAVYEYINIDPCTTEPTTYFGGRTYPTGNYDGTKNSGLYITNCYFNIDEDDPNFQYLDDAIGCHTPWDQHHENINIVGNKILNFKKFAIRASDMINSVIRGNYMESSVNTEYAIACYSKAPDTVPSVVNLTIQDNVIKVANNCISAQSTRYLCVKDNLYYPGDNARHAVCDLYGAITDHATIVGNKTNFGYTPAFSLTTPHLDTQVFEAVQETPLAGTTVSNDVLTSPHVNFTEFSTFVFLFGYVSGGTCHTRTVKNWYANKTFPANTVFPIIVDDTGATVMSFTISADNPNTMTITKKEGLSYPALRGVLVSK